MIKFLDIYKQDKKFLGNFILDFKKKIKKNKFH